MPETTPDPTTTETPAKPKSPRTRSAIDQTQLKELTLAEQLALTVEKADYAPVFAVGGIDGAFLDPLKADIAKAKELASAAVQTATSKQSVTQSEAATQARLVELLREVQARARQKHAARNKVALKDYFIGTKLDASRAQVIQITQSILQRLKTDPLPGIDAARISALEGVLNTYINIQTVQSGTQADATTARAELATAIASIAEYRRQIQFAADAQWPASNKENAGVRKEFGLNPRKAFKG